MKKFIFTVLAVVSLSSIFSRGLDADEGLIIRRDPDYIRFEVHDGIGFHNMLKVVFVDSITKEERDTKYYLGFEWIPYIEQIVTKYENLREEARNQNRDAGRVVKFVQLDMNYLSKIRSKRHFTNPTNAYYSGAEGALTIIDAPTKPQPAPHGNSRLKEELLGLLTKHRLLQQKLTQAETLLEAQDFDAALIRIQQSQKIEEEIFENLSRLVVQH